MCYLVTQDGLSGFLEGFADVKLRIINANIVQQIFNNIYSQYFRIVWTIIFMALAIGLFGEVLYGATQAGTFPIALIGIVLVSIWLTYLTRKDDELDAMFDDRDD